MELEYQARMEAIQKEEEDRLKKLEEQKKLMQTQLEE